MLSPPLSRSCHSGAASERAATPCGDCDGNSVWLAYIDHVTRLTQSRDRDVSDSVFVNMLVELLQPGSVQLLDVVPHSGQPYCVPRLEWCQGMEAAVQASHWQQHQHGWALATQSAAQEAVDNACAVLRPERGGTRLWLPFSAGHGMLRLVDLHFNCAVTPQAQALVQGLTGIYSNFLSLLDYSERDSLTSLLNRKSFDETFYKATNQLLPPPQVLAVAGDGEQRDPPDTTTSAHYWLAVVDVDHFKHVNDKHGHLIGDEVLLLLARLMRHNFRHDDRLYRFGGEEFVVLLRTSETAHAAQALERLRASVEAYPFPQVGRLTVSIGYTRIRHHDTPAATFERADAVLYQAKQRGRNQVLCFEQEQASGKVNEQVIDSVVELF